MSKMRKRWSLCHATDFQSLMYPCFICCRILGIFPYKLKASTFEISISHYILSTVVISICCIFYGIIIRDIILKMYDGDVPKHLNHMIYRVLCGLIVVNTHISSFPRMRVLQAILEVSTKVPRDAYRKMSRFIHVKDILSISLKFIQIYIYFSKAHFQLYDYNYLATVTTMYLAMFRLQTNMLYVNCVCILKACFKSINDTLKYMQLVINTRKPCIAKFIFHVQEDRFLLIKLKALKKRYMMISDAVQMLNMNFSFPLLATIIMIFSTTTFQLYLNAVHWQDGIIIRLDRYFLDVLSAAMIYNITMITLLMWACETGKNQAKEIDTTIHDLLNIISDENIKYELQSFSLQILHCKNTFSARGITIDVTLLAAMVGNITTYLVILLQFLDISHCNRKLAVNVTQHN